MGSVTLKFKDKKGKTVKIKPKDVWGFLVKGKLFRMDIPNNQPVKVIVSEKLMYYENGVGHLSPSLTEFGYGSAISETLNSEIVPIPFKEISVFRSNYVKFKDEHPQFKEFFDCYEDAWRKPGPGKDDKVCLKFIKEESK